MMFLKSSLVKNVRRRAIWSAAVVGAGAAGGWGAVKGATASALVEEPVGAVLAAGETFVVG